MRPASYACVRLEGVEQAQRYVRRAYMHALHDVSCT
jgi:hypothetical protein